MNTADLIRILHNQQKPLIESSFGELRRNLGTSSYHRLSNEELFQRAAAVLQLLSSWLTSRDPASIHHFAADLGRKRFAQGVPLGQVVLAILLQERSLWDYITAQTGQSPDEKLRLEVAEFYARTIYSTALGYSDALAESQRTGSSGGEVGERPSPPSPYPVKPVQNDLPVSRGGEIGEQGG